MGITGAEISFLDRRILLPTLLLCVALLVGAGIVAWVERWRKRQDRTALTPHDQLASFRVLYEQGQMSEEEYQRVKARLTAKIKPKAPPAAPPSENITELPPAPPDPPPPPETPGA